MSYGDQFTEALAFDQVGNDEMKRAIGADIEYPHDVRMAETGNAQRLLFESLIERLVGQSRIKEFDDDRVFGRPFLNTRENGTGPAAGDETRHAVVTE
jgi:hypothetical protein